MASSIEALNASKPVWYREECWTMVQHGPHGGGVAFYLQETEKNMCGK